MYIFGGQVDDFYLDDIVAFDMKSSKLPFSPFQSFQSCCLVLGFANRWGKRFNQQVHVISSFSYTKSALG